MLTHTLCSTFMTYAYSAEGEGRATRAGVHRHGREDEMLTFKEATCFDMKNGVDHPSHAPADERGPRPHLQAAEATTAAALASSRPQHVGKKGCLGNAPPASARSGVVPATTAGPKCSAYSHLLRPTWSSRPAPLPHYVKIFGRIFLEIVYIVWRNTVKNILRKKPWSNGLN